MGDVVAAIRPLTRHQLAVAAVLADGHTLEEAARLLGVERSTVDFHAHMAALRIPGDLPRVAKLIVWYRLANGVEVLGGGPLAARQASIRAALAIAEGRGCPQCGYSGVTEVHHERTPATASGDSRPP